MNEDPVGRMAGGAVTLLLGDLEDSTPKWERRTAGMREAMPLVGILVDGATAAHGGTRPVEQGDGDSFVVAFARPTDGLSCARELGRSFSDQIWPDGLKLRFRMALHVGEVDMAADGTYMGAALARCARVRDLASGGQLLATGAFHAVVVDVAAPEVDMVDLGTVGLRGLNRTERIFEVVDKGEAARGLGAVGHRGSSLPAELTPLVGRHAELEAVTRLLAQRSLVSLIGAGGSGKTRLAARLGHVMVNDYRDGVVWVDVAGLQDPALLPLAVATAAGVGPLPTIRPREGLLREMVDQQTLVILDNCEHLADGCAEVTTALLHGCEDVRLLVTSREPLGADGEVVYRVPSLAVPAPAAGVEEIAGTDAVRLLLERAAAARPEFRLTDENAGALAGICRRLDGLPLALELAAARLRVLSPQQVLDGLDDRFRLLTGGSRRAVPRQRTLEASVEWSYDMLDVDDQLVLQRLSVFARTFDLAAAEAVCGADVIEAHAILDRLTRLVDRSLVNVSSADDLARYELLETIRVYAARELARSGDVAAVRDRHLDHVRHLVAAEGAGLAAADPRQAIGRLWADLDNIRAALDWAMESGRADEAIGLIQDIHAFWLLRGLQSEMYDRLMDALEGGGLDDATRARGYVTASSFALSTLEARISERLATKGLELARTGSDLGTLCDALLHWAWNSWQAGTASEADMRMALTEAEQLAEVLADPMRRWHAHLYRTLVEGLSTTTERGLESADRTLELAAAAGAPQLALWSRVWFSAGSVSVGLLDRAVEHAAAVSEQGDGLSTGSRAAAHTSLGRVEMLRGNLDAADDHLSQADQAWLRDHQTHRRGTTENHAEVLYRRGDLAAAREIAGRALASARDRGHGFGTTNCLWLLGILDLETEELTAARAHFDEALAVCSVVPFRAALGWVTLGLSYTAAAENEPEQAWQLAHDAVESFGTIDNAFGIAVSLESLAGLGAERGLGELGVRLLGAAERMAEEIGYARRPIEVRVRARAAQSLRGVLTPQDYDRAFAEGLGLARPDVLSHARRGRGARSRPATGWDSLTPAELDVARLAAGGLTNVAVAERLFITVNTVKTHLTHVYAKLGVASRTELAGEASRRGIL